MDDVAIKVENVSKTFKLPHERTSSIKDAVINFYRRNRSFETQQALEDISFEIKKGEFFGIVGRNGSGKSTLLKMLAGIYLPDTGTIQINGKLTPFIELGVGFSPELTGRENVFLNGALLGFSRKEMHKMYHDIVGFAELHKFMDQKLKNYSSGMQVRLAFSIAIRARSDILVLDEVLAVGDAAFQKKCVETFRFLKESGKTIVLVSHSTGDIERFCDRVLVIDQGKQVGVMDAMSAVTEYQTINIETKEEGMLRSKQPKQTRWGTKELQHGDVQFLQNGKKTSVINTGQDLEVRVEVKRHQQSQEAMPFQVGLAFYDQDRNNISGPNSYDVKLELREGQDKQIVSYILPKVIFNQGEYKLTVAILGKKGDVTYDHHLDAAKFNVVTKKIYHGKVILDGRWVAEA
jgi:ABC-2 type transport system ATP-binding protein